MKVVPIETMSGGSEVKPSLTWMSWLARAIIVISPVSSNKGWTDLKLKFFSKATLIYLLLFYGPMLLLVVATIINGDHSQIVMKSMINLFKTYNLIDSFSYLIFVTGATGGACKSPPRWEILRPEHP